MHSDDYEYWSDSSIEEDNILPIDIESIYKNITNSLRKIIKRKPLFNNLPLSDAIKSRITVLTGLYVIMFKRYEYDFNESWFLVKLCELKDGIYGIAKIVDDMESKIEKLKYLSDSSDRCIGLFPSPIDEYLNATRREIIKDFNDFISENDWLIFDSVPKKIYKRLPLLDELKIPEDLI